MNQIPDDILEETTREGNRRAQLRRALDLSLRERLQAVEDMAEVAERFRQIRTHGRGPEEKETADAGY